MNAMTNLPLHARRVVNICPISSEGWAAMSGDRRATHASATANYHYITRTLGSDARGALDFRHRDDLVAHGIELPTNHPVDRRRKQDPALSEAITCDISKLWVMKRSRSASARPPVDVGLESKFDCLAKI